MNEDPTKKAEDRRHEARVKRLAAKAMKDPAWKDVHYSVAGEDDPKVQAFNQAMREQRRRKVN